MKHALDPETSYLLHNEFLNSVDCAYHLYYKVILCLGCKTAWSPEALQGHLITHRLILPANFPTLLSTFLLTHPVTPPTSVPLPKFGEPPVEGLAIFDGFECFDCCYAAIQQKSMRNHYKVDHPTEARTHGEKKWTKVKVQTFFNPVPRRYFTVNPSLLNVASDTAYSVFIRDVLPTIEPVFQPMPQNPHHITPLVQMTGWADYLDELDLLKSRRAIRDLVSFTQLPTAKEPVLQELENWVWHYITWIHDSYVTKAPYLVRRMILHCPM